MHSYIASRLAPGNIIFPCRIKIDAINVTYYKGNIIGYESTIIPRTNIASVNIISKILFADVIIETRGGKSISHYASAHGYTATTIHPGQVESRQC